MFPKQQDDDEVLIAKLATEYLAWLSGEDGVRDPAEVVRGLTPLQAQLYAAAIDDMNLIWGITAPLRSPTRVTSLER